jgi:hypothetical protein
LPTAAAPHLPFAPELRPRAPATPRRGGLDGPALLAAVARTGGRVLTDPTAIFDPGTDTRETSQPSDPILLVCLAVRADVLLRRVRLGTR